MFLYLVKMTSQDKAESFYKIGVTNSGVKDRFAFGKTKVIDNYELSLREKLEKTFEGEKYSSDTPYYVEELHTVSYQYEGDALEAEEKLLDVLKKYQYFPKNHFSGHTECFNNESAQEMIIKFMNADHMKKNQEAPNELRYKLAEMALNMRNQLRDSDPISRHKKIMDEYKRQKNA